MTGAIVSADEPVEGEVFLKFSIRDETTGKQNSRAAPSLSSVSSLYKSIAGDFGYVPHTFSLFFASPHGEEIELDPTAERSVCELGLNQDRVNRLVIRQRDDETEIKSVIPVPPPIIFPTATPSSKITSFDEARSNIMDSIKATRKDDSSSTSSSYSYTSNWSTSGQQSSTGFVGLANQGATCYLNSLLQTLFMTPEFRNALYEWKTESAEASIPLELQKLFIQLQTSTSRAVETQRLTKSFGWEGGEAFQQHDVQELLRVLFDALEQEWAGSPLEKTIKDLYEGEMSDFVECKECGYVSEKLAKFMDVQLVLKPFGATKVLSSVDEALDKFVEIEHLDEHNLYQCSKCNKKVEALKGLKFTKFPYLLTLQLKRFDFNYMNMQRIKINDKVTFSTILDLSRFVPRTEGAESTSSVGAPSLDSSATTASASTPTSATPTDGISSPADTASSSAAPSDGVASASSASAEATDGGDGNQYELFSIMIHSGSALGGHYYAYIKCLWTGKWYSFNDSTVTEIGTEELEKAFGGPMGKYTSSSTSGYMLMYRRIDKQRNVTPYSEDSLPESFKATIAKLAEEERIKAEEEELKKVTITLDVYLSADPTKTPEFRPIKLSKKLTYAEGMEKIKEVWDLKDVPLERLRIRKYYPTRQHSEAVIVPKEGQTLADLGLTYTYSSIDLLLEMADADGVFQEFNPNLVNIVLVLFQDGKLQEPRKLGIDKEATIGDLRATVAPLLGCKVSEVRLAKGGMYYHPSKPMVGDTRNMRIEFYVGGGTVIYADSSFVEDDTADPIKAFEQTPLCKAIELRTNAINLRVVLPDEPEDSEGHKVTVDQRILLSEFKANYVLPLLGEGITVDEFTVFRLRGVSGDAKMEVGRLADSLRGNFVDDDCKLWVRRGKALKVGEVTVMVVLFRLGHEKPVQELFSFPVQKDDTVLQFKTTVAKMAKDKLAENPEWEFKNVSFDVERMRLRDMIVSSDGPRGIFLNEEKLPYLFANKKLCVELLPGPDPKTHAKQRVVYVRRWRPEEFKLDPLEEVCVDAPYSMSRLAQILSEKSGIAIENVGFARCTEYFPYEPAWMDMDKEKWNVKDVELLSDSPFYITTDGACVFYRDNTQKLKELTAEEKTKIQKDDQARSKLGYSDGYYTGRKETALKIHVKNKAKSGAGAGNGEEEEAAPAATVSEDGVKIHPPVTIKEDAL